MAIGGLWGDHKGGDNGVMGCGNMGIWGCGMRGYGVIGVVIGGVGWWDLRIWGNGGLWGDDGVMMGL